LLVVPGIEITTQEEVHLLAYFNTVEQLVRFYQEIKEHITPLKTERIFLGTN
jgi:3',5'-nucleoside bisphosphate phosphatase